MGPRVVKGTPRERTGRASRAAKPADVDGELAKARASLSQEGAVKASSIKAGSVREAVVTALSAEGYELSKSWLRVPLRKQLAGALAHGAVLPEKSLKQHVAGASRVELEAALDDALERGQVRRIVRGRATALVGAEAAVVDVAAAVEIHQELAALATWLRTATRKKAGVLRSDVDEALANVRARVDSCEQPRLKSKDKLTDTLVAAVLESIEATKERSGLSFVPKVVARLAPPLTTDAARTAILAAARQDLLELRPEGGLGRLTRAELEQCLPGPEGTYLSWVRVRKGAG